MSDEAPNPIPEMVSLNWDEAVKLARKMIALGERMLYAVKKHNPALVMSSDATFMVIVKCVCDHYGIKRKELFHKGRQHNLAYPRFIVMYLARKYTELSLNDLAKYFRCDHANVMHGVKKVQDLLAQPCEARFQQSVQTLERRTQAALIEQKQRDEKL